MTSEKDINMNRLCLIVSTVILLSINPYYCHGQDDDLRYLVVTYERTVHHDKSHLVYFWIMSYNSSDDYQLYPLSFCAKDAEYLEIASKEELSEEFLQAIHYPIDETIPILLDSPLYNLNGEEYDLLKKGSDNSMLDAFLKVVLSHRIEVMSYTKRWKHDKRKKEIIRVFITPVRGSFNKGWAYVFADIHSQLSHAGYAYYLDSAIVLDERFMSTSVSDHLNYPDFSFVDFSQFSLQDFGDVIQCKW